MGAPPSPFPTPPVGNLIWPLVPFSGNTAAFWLHPHKSSVPRAYCSGATVPSAPSTPTQPGLWLENRHSQCVGGGCEPVNTVTSIAQGSALWPPHHSPVQQCLDDIPLFLLPCVLPYVSSQLSPDLCAPTLVLSAPLRHTHLCTLSVDLLTLSLTTPSSNSCRGSFPKC